MEKLRTINATLCLIRQGEQLLLGEKQRGFAKGTYNGIGGKQDPGETIEQAMIRETQEEIGVTPTEYTLVGQIHFETWYKGDHVYMKLYIYNCSQFRGTPQTTAEMRPQWFTINNLPYDQMLADDKLWYPYYLRGQKFVGEVKFTQQGQMEHSQFSVVDHLPATI